MIPSKIYGDKLFQLSLVLASTIALVAMGGIVIFLFKEGLPALRAFGLQFVFSDVWDPINGKYGAGAMLYGTLVTSCIAITLAVPFALVVVFFITEVVPFSLIVPVSLGIQLLAAVPSVVYGMWGFFVVVPVMISTVEPFLISTLGVVPLLGNLFVGEAHGLSFLTCGFVLALMILPFITSMVLRAIVAVPAIIREASYGVGSASYEVFFRILVPHIRSVIAGATLLGLGRALGEAMAVSFVVGNVTSISLSLLAPGSTMASLIANEFHEAEYGSVLFHALLALGFILFVMSSLLFALFRFFAPYRGR